MVIVKKVKFSKLGNYHQSIPRQNLPPETKKNKKTKNCHSLFTQCKCNLTTTTTRRFKRHFDIEWVPKQNEIESLYLIDLMMEMSGARPWRRLCQKLA